MRQVCAILPAALFAISFGAVPARGGPSVTLILQFDEAYSTDSLNAMKHEVASIVGRSGVRFDWKMINDVRPSDSFENLVVVHFHGACLMEQTASLPDERGYYAFTHTSNGSVLPFSEVECDKIRSSIRPAMTSQQWQRGNAVFGRALGRVVAHELFHMLAKTESHAHSGVTKTSLTPEQLISENLPMAAPDLDRLRRQKNRP